MATTQERIARVLLRVGIDKPAMTDTQNALKTFNKTLADLERQKGLSRIAQDSARAVTEGKSLRVELGRMKAELLKVGASSSEVEKVVREFDRLRESADRAATATSASTGNKLLRSIGTDIRNLPAVPIPGTGISTDVIGKVLNTIGRLNVDMKQLAISGGLASVAIVGVALAFQNFEKVVSPIQNLVTAIIRSRAELAGFLATASPEEVVNAQKQAQDAVTETSNKIFSTIADYNTALANLFGQGAFGEFIARVQATFRSGPVGGALNDLEKYQQELVDQQITLQGLNTVLEENQRLLEQVTFDYAAFRQQQIDQDLFNILRITIGLRDESASVLRKRLDGLNEEKAALENIFANQVALGISGDAVTKISDRLHDVNIEMGLLNDALPRAEQIEAAKAAFDKLKEGAEDFVKDTAKISQDLQKVGQEIGTLRSDFRSKIVDIQNKLQEQLIEADRDRNLALVEARRDADLAEAEAVRKAGMDRADIERESAIAIQRILRRSKIDINNAIQDRDAVALDAARTRKQEELAQERQNRDERLRELNIELSEQLRTIRMRLGEQNRTIDQRYQEQVRRVALAAQKSIEIETAKFNRELALKQMEAAKLLQLQQQTIATTINGANQVLGINMTFWQNMATIGRNALSALFNNSAQVQKFGSGGSNNVITKFLKGLTGLETGGRILSDGLVYAHAGEMVVNPRRGQGGNVVFAPQINGTNKTTMRREIIRQLDQFIEDNF